MTAAVESVWTLDVLTEGFFSAPARWLASEASFYGLDRKFRMEHKKNKGDAYIKKAAFPQVSRKPLVVAVPQPWDDGIQLPYRIEVELRDTKPASSRRSYAHAPR